MSDTEGNKLRWYGTMDWIIQINRGESGLDDMDDTTDSTVECTVGGLGDERDI